MKIKTTYMHVKIVPFWGSDITHLKISPTFVLFGHVMRCFLQYLSIHMHIGFEIVERKMHFTIAF